MPHPTPTPSCAQVRYESRKKLAEARPRVRGQFVRQAQEGGSSGCMDTGSPAPGPAPAGEPMEGGASPEGAQGADELQQQQQFFVQAAMAAGQQQLAAALVVVAGEVAEAQAEAQEEVMAACGGGV